MSAASFETMTPDEIAECLEAEAESDLIGEPETAQLDFKSAPYQLTTDKGKWEPAKDVAAMANSGGGCLAIGVATTVSSDLDEEVASKIRPFPAHMFDSKQMRDVISSGVYPMPRGLDIRRFPRPDGKAMGVVVVPPQTDDDQPFIVTGMLDQDDKRGIGVGVPIRSGSHTTWLPPGQIHRDLSDGRRSRTTLPVLPTSPATPHVSEAIAERSGSRLDAIEHYMGWGDGATLMLGAVPVEPQQTPIPGFYDPQRILGCVKAPPEIRWAGFAIAYDIGSVENLDGSLINSTPDRTILWADPDGAVFAGAAGLGTFLTRAGGSGTDTAPGPRNINPVVLGEWTYLYFKFLTECVASSVEGPMRWVVSLRGPVSRPWTLRLFGGLHQVLLADGQPAGLDDFEADDVVTGEPERDAFVALTRIYSVFGLGPEQIPLSTDGRIDPAQIQALNT